MKFAKLIVVSSVVALSAIGAQAEEYQGVLQFNSTATRAEMRSEAVVAAQTPNPYAEGANSGSQEVFVSQVARNAVRAEAVAAARAGDTYGDAAYAGVVPRMTSGLERATVRAEARVAARDGREFAF